MMEFNKKGFAVLLALSHLVLLPHLLASIWSRLRLAYLLNRLLGHAKMYQIWL